MARSDWWYPNIPRKQADALDVIVKKEGLKYGIIDKNELVRFIIADFIIRYENEHGLISAIKGVQVHKSEGANDDMKKQRRHHIDHTD